MMEVRTMNESAEATVRNFFATWPRSDVDEMVTFFSADAVYTDGPRGTYRGVDAIRAELESMGQLVPSTRADVKVLVVNGDTVMVERVDIFQMQGKTFEVEMAGIFDIESGRIKRWRDYYDMRSLEERVAAELASAG
jgi:limonene-1,2-epoxide hydrolase